MSEDSNNKEPFGQEQRNENPISIKVQKILRQADSATGSADHSQTMLGIQEASSKPQDGSTSNCSSPVRPKRPEFQIKAEKRSKDKRKASMIALRSTVEITSVTIVKPSSSEAEILAHAAYMINHLQEQLRQRDTKIDEQDKLLKIFKEVIIMSGLKNMVDARMSLPFNWD